MYLYEVLNLSGLMFSIIGAYFGAKGFFSEKNKDLYGRTLLYFFNKEHFESIVSQKYREISGFILIIIGSVMQLISNIIGKNFIKIDCQGYILTFILIIIMYLLLTIINKIVNFIIKEEINIILACEWLKDYENLKIDETEEKKSQLANLLIEISKQLNISNETDEIEIVKIATIYRDKHVVKGKKQNNKKLL